MHGYKEKLLLVVLFWENKTKVQRANTNYYPIKILGKQSTLYIKYLKLSMVVYISSSSSKLKVKEKFAWKPILFGKNKKNAKIKLNLLRLDDYNFLFKVFT